MSPSPTAANGCASLSGFGICRCYFRRNFFLHRWGEHVHLKDGTLDLQDKGDEERFLAQFSQRPDRREAWAEVREELRRRREFQPKLVELRKEVRARYQPLHPEVYQLREEILEPAFLRAVKAAKEGRVPDDPDFQPLKQGAFAMPVLKKDFCAKLIEELDNFAVTDLPRNQPNTMNKYGLILDDLGFTSFIDKLRDEYIQPLSDVLYKEDSPKLDSHRSFTVTYEPGGVDKAGLHSHWDNAEVTLNVALDDDYEGGELVFSGMKTEPEARERDLFGYAHRLGTGVLHPGALRHEALPVERGRRTNLILWMRSSEERRRECPRCGERPDVEPVQVGYGDGFRVEVDEKR